MKHLLRLSVIPLASLVAIGCGGGDDGDDGNNPDAAPPAPACSIQSENEATPGSPYNLNTFETQVMPDLTANCASCHTGDNFLGGFQFFVGERPDCNFINTFNTLINYIDLVNPANSRLVVAKQLPGHPDYDEQIYLNYITEAANNGGGGGITPPPVASPADFTVFTNAIQPLFDAQTCTAGGCHGAGAGTFLLTPNATGDALGANFIETTARYSLDLPNNSLVYLKATNNHGGWTSTMPDGTAEAGILLGWIEAAAANNTPTGGGPNVGCVSPDSYNIGVFEDEILPMFRGDLDWNDVGNESRFNGCVANGQCHGVVRQGKFSLANSMPIEDMFSTFLCYVNQGNPSRSAVVMCPLGSQGSAFCPVGHPGGEIFPDAEDLNFQKLLSFVYSGRGTVQPFDFAFFIRNINTIFNDFNAVQGGALGLTCADRAECHGVDGPGQPVPGGSNFPIIGEQIDIGSLTFNFTSAASFANFLIPNDSSLRIYPTNLIFAGSDFATGLAHRGGECFPPGSAEDQVISKFVAGLQPDAAGNIFDFLVFGDFNAAQITDEPIANENQLEAVIFDRLGSREFNNGEADLFSSADAFVDLNIPFPRDQTAGRIAYAQLCVFNAGSRVEDVQFVVDTAASQNDSQIYVNGVLTAQGAAGAATAISRLNPFISGGEPARLLLKIFQPADDNIVDGDFGFEFKVLDENGNVFLNNEIIFTTSCKNGGGL
jgi:hypothetical protein